MLAVLHFVFSVKVFQARFWNMESDSKTELALSCSLHDLIVFNLFGESIILSAPAMVLNN